MKISANTNYFWQVVSDRILIGGMWFGLASANQCKKRAVPTNDNLKLRINCTIMKAKIAAGHV